MRRRDSATLAALIATWLVAVGLANPLGDFPSNDDWAYAWTVRHLLETGDLRFSDWTAANLLPQALWGTLFCLPLGFSFTALRLSTLTLGLIGVVATYGVLREVRATPMRALAAALTVALNPIYFALSHTFMTDVPSFTFMMTSLYLLTRALRRESARALVAGLVICCIAVLNRQTALLALPAFGAAYIVNHGFGFRAGLTAGLPTAVGVAVYLVYPAWLRITDRTPYLYDFQTALLWRSLSRSIPEVAATFGHNVVVIVMYCSVFLLPFILMGGLECLRSYDAWRRWKIAAGIVVVAVAAGWMAKYARMPLTGNVLNIAGIGPTAIAGWPAGLDLKPYLIARGWQVVTAAGVAGAVLMLWALVEAARVALSQPARPGTRAPAVLAAAIAGLYVLPIATLQAGAWFDRYLLPLLTPLMVLISVAADRWVASRWTVFGTVIGAVLLIVYGALTVSMTHDYLAWNRTRWHALSTLLRESGSPRERVDGGFEFNGWFFGNRLDACNPQRARDPDARDRSWGDFTCIWERRDAQYFVSPVVGEGTHVEGFHTFTRWFPPGTQTLYVLRRGQAADRPPSASSGPGAGTARSR